MRIKPPSASHTQCPNGVLRYIYSFFDPNPARRNGRERSVKFVELSKLSRPASILPTLKVTGTNGKGSTVALAEGLLGHQGRHTVTLSSPHCYSIRERVRLNGRIIEWAELEMLLDGIAPFLEAMRGTEWHPRPIDIMTWVSFAYHAKAEHGTVGIYEVGKGGQSDSTNAFSDGIVGLTNLGHDHLAEFGGTMDTLLIEKLGLCARGRTLCYLPLNETLEVLVRDHCKTHDVLALRAGDIEPDSLTSGAVDAAARQNIALSYALVKVLGGHSLTAVPALCEIANPGRVQTRIVAGRTFVLDGAHNIEAVTRSVHLASRRQCVKRIVVIAIQQRKDWRSLVKCIAGISSLSEVICIETTRGDPVNPGVLSAAICQCGGRATAFPGMLSGLGYAFSRDWEEALIIGSFTLLRDFDLSLHVLGYGEFAVPLEMIDPDQPWMRPLG